MRKTIPFKKEILFKTKLKEVTSISLEHNYKVSDDIISGEFLVSGDYKITSASINREEFSYKIPFEIALDSRYDENNIILDIENFYYEIINDEILKVNIDVFVEGEYKKEETISKFVEPPKPAAKPPREETITPEVIKNSTEDRSSIESSTQDEDLINSENRHQKPPLYEESNITTNAENLNSKSSENKVNLFDNISMEDTYSTYYVYIVKEEDTLETILTKYNISKEDLENYNDLSNVMPNDKIIIPSSNE